MFEFRFSRFLELETLRVRARGAKGRRFKVSCLVHLCTRLRSSDSPNRISQTSARLPFDFSDAPCIRTRNTVYVLRAEGTFVPADVKGVASRVNEHDIRSRVDAPREVEYVVLSRGTFPEVGQPSNRLE